MKGGSSPERELEVGWITRYGGHEKLICQNPRKLVNPRSLISNPNLTDTNPIFKGSKYQKSFGSKFDLVDPDVSKNPFHRNSTLLSPTTS